MGVSGFRVEGLGFRVLGFGVEGSRADPDGLGGVPYSTPSPKPKPATL